MQISMSLKEIDLFTIFLESTSNYGEFGSGGSTVLAAKTVKTSVTSIDSSILWLSRVKEYCISSKLSIDPNLNFVDIGPIGDWGIPIDASMKHNWPNYSKRLFADVDRKDYDLILVDGRFRIACFANSILQSHQDTIIVFHDFANRSKYHVVHEIGREIAKIENISMFVRRRDIQNQKIIDMIDQFSYDYG